MNSVELRELVDKQVWLLLGSGTYNQVQVSEDEFMIDGYCGKWVRKVRVHKVNEPLSVPARGARKWNLLNPDYPAFELDDCWIAPYLGDTAPTDEQIAVKLLDIYKRTGEIIVDGCGLDNFRVYKGEVFCIDVDLSLRRNSDATLDYLSNKQDVHHLNDFLNISSKSLPESGTVIQSLLYLEKNIAEDELNKSALTLRLLAIVNRFRLHKQKISPGLIDFIAYFTRNMFETLNNAECVTPFFFETMYHLKQKNLAKEAAYDLLLNPETAGLFTSYEFKYLMTRILEREPFLINKIGDHGYTVLHIAVMYRCVEAVMYLVDKKANLDIISLVSTAPDVYFYYPDMTALDIAYSLYNSSLIAFLLKSNDAQFALLPTIEQNMLEIYNAPEEMTTFSDQVRFQLYDLAKSPPNAKSEKGQLLSLIMQYPQLLSWELDNIGTNFLGLIFIHKNLWIINELRTHPQWDLLTQIRKTTDGWTLWHIVAASGHLDLCTVLNMRNIHALSKRTRSSALHIAANRGNEFSVEVLLQLGANPTQENTNGCTPLNCWKYSEDDIGPFEQFQNALYLLGRNENNLSKEWKTRLTLLIMSNPQLLTWPLHQDGRAIICYAFHNGHSQLIHEIATTPDWPNISKHSNYNEWTLLHHLACAGNTDLLIYLKEININAQTTDWGKTALFIAVEQGHSPFCRALLEQGANPYLCDYEGNSTLIAAAKANSESLVQLILEYKVHPEHKNLEGLTAKDYWPEYAHLFELEKSLKTSPHIALSLLAPSTKRQDIKVHDVNECIDTLMSAVTK
jgi:ankyrin repeat protein